MRSTGLVFGPAGGAEWEFGAVGEDQGLADGGVGEVADDVEGLEVAAEAFQVEDGNGEEELAVVSAIHRGGDGIDIEFAAELEGVALEGDAFRIDFGAEPGREGEAFDGVGESVGDQAAGAGVDFRFFEGGDGAGRKFWLEIGADEHPVALQA